MHLSPVSLSLTTPRGASWSPSNLFAAGEQGAWYDPSDYSTLFQDAAGTTPVTAVEQPVGLMLDKSKGLAIGSNLATYPNFESGATGWSVQTGWSVSVGSASINSNGGSPSLYAGAIVAGVWYKITVTVSSYTSGNLYVLAGSTWLTSAPITASGTKTYYVLAAGSGGIGVVGSGSNVVATVTSISGYAISGNHASQSTSTKRPVLRARYNLLTYSQVFTNAVWTSRGGATVTDNTSLTTDPLGGNTAASVSVGTGGTDFFQGMTITGSLSGYALSPTFYIKANGTSGKLNVTSPGGPSLGAWTLDLSLLSAGWNRISSTHPAVTVTTAFTVSNSVGYNGLYFNSQSGTQNFFLWGTDLRFGTSTTYPYQQISSATSYNSTGFLPYLAFDGVDDALATSSIDFTGTNKMSVFAGVTKKSDASTAIINELSADATANNGSYYLAILSAGTGYSFSSRGTVNTSATSTGFSAPITNVLSGLFDIAAPSNIQRANGTQVQSNVTSQGTGNYGNYALNIGSRNNGASLPLNGNLYSLIVRGATTSAADIVNTETWVNSRTGAY